MFVVSSHAHIAADRKYTGDADIALLGYRKRFERNQQQEGLDAERRYRREAHPNAVEPDTAGLAIEDAGIDILHRVRAEMRGATSCRVKSSTAMPAS